MSLASRMCNNCGGPLAVANLNYQTKCPWCNSNYSDTHATTVKTATNTDRTASELAIMRLEKLAEQTRASISHQRSEYDSMLNAYRTYLNEKRDELLKDKYDPSGPLIVASFLLLIGLISLRTPAAIGEAIFLLLISFGIFMIVLSRKHRTEKKNSELLAQNSEESKKVPPSCAYLQTSIAQDERKLAQLQSEINQHHAIVRMDR